MWQVKRNPDMYIYLYQGAAQLSLEGAFPHFCMRLFLPLMPMPFSSSRHYNISE